MISVRYRHLMCAPVQKILTNPISEVWIETKFDYLPEIPVTPEPPDIAVMK
jgi:hypothetical protein